MFDRTTSDEVHFAQKAIMRQTSDDVAQIRFPATLGHCPQMEPKMRSSGALLILTALFCAGGPAAEDRNFSDYKQLLGLERQTLTGSGGQRLDVLYFQSDWKRPALVFIPGSLCAPSFITLDSKPGELFGTVPFLSAEQRGAMDAHVIYLERRNSVSLRDLASLPEFSTDEISKRSPCTDGNGGTTLDHRVVDTLTQIRWLREQPWVDSIHLVGVSEGADVAAGVVATDSRAADSLMLIGGAGASQFADFVASARQRGQQDGVESAFRDLDQFLLARAPDPYKGYSARRWQSFALENTVFDLLQKSSIPLFIAHGDQDESVPVSSADLIAVEIMRKQPDRAIFYWTVVGGDHMLKTEDGSQLGELIIYYFNWANSHPVGRRFRSD